MCRRDRGSNSFVALYPFGSVYHSLSPAPKSQFNLHRSSLTFSLFSLGFYIYKQLEHAPGIRTYYGIPKVLHENGMHKDTGLLCIVSPSRPDCIPMEKTFYLQYQWFPFYTAILGVLYYMPYVLFRFVNTDLISLKGNIKGKTS